MKQKNTKNFGTRWGFILASVGSAVGMANVGASPTSWAATAAAHFC